MDGRISKWMSGVINKWMGEYLTGNAVHNLQ